MTSDGAEAGAKEDTLDDDIPDWAVPDSRGDDASSESSGDRWRRSPSPQTDRAAATVDSAGKASLAGKASAGSGKGLRASSGRGPPLSRQPRGPALRNPSRPLIYGVRRTPSLQHHLMHQPRAPILNVAALPTPRGVMMAVGGKGIRRPMVMRLPQVRPGQVFAVPQAVRPGWPVGLGVVHGGRGSWPPLRPAVHAITRSLPPIRSTVPFRRHSRPLMRPAGPRPRLLNQQPAAAVRASRTINIVRGLPRTATSMQALRSPAAGTAIALRSPAARTAIAQVSARLAQGKGSSRGVGQSALRLPASGRQQLAPPPAANMRMTIGRSTLWRGIVKRVNVAKRAQGVRRDHPAGLSPAASGGHQQDHAGSKATAASTQPGGKKRDNSLMKSDQDSFGHLPGVTPKGKAAPPKVRLQRRGDSREDRAKCSEESVREWRSGENSSEREIKRPRRDSAADREVYDHIDKGRFAKHSEHVNRSTSSAYASKQSNSHPIGTRGDSVRKVEHSEHTAGQGKRIDSHKQVGRTRYVEKSEHVDRAERHRQTSSQDKREDAESSGITRSSEHTESLRHDKRQDNSSHHQYANRDKHREGVRSRSRSRIKTRKSSNVRVVQLDEWEAWSAANDVEREEEPLKRRLKPTLAARLTPRKDLGAKKGDKPKPGRGGVSKMHGFSDSEKSFLSSSESPRPPLRSGRGRTRKTDRDTLLHW